MHLQHNCKIGHYLAHRLEELGVKEYFVVPGSIISEPRFLEQQLIPTIGDYNLDLLDQILEQSDVRMINCCNELNAGYAADGYARTSDSRIAVVVVTYMVGSMSVLNAIAGAYAEGQKVIVLCGGPDSSSYGSDVTMHHSLGLPDKEQSVRIFDQITCGSMIVGMHSVPGDIDLIIQKCCDDSRPIYIEIPADLVHDTFFSSLEVNGSAIKGINQHGILHQPTLVESMAVNSIQMAWERAQLPIILIGGAWRDRLSVGEIDALVTKLGCTAFYLLDGKSRVTESHPQCGGMFWSIVSHPGVEETVRAADLWLTIGCQWHDLHTLKAINLAENSSRMLAINEDSIRLPDGGRIENISVKSVTKLLIDSDVIPNNASCFTLSEYRSGTRAVSNATSQTDAHELISIDDIVAGITPHIKPYDTVLADAGESWFAASNIKLPSQAEFHVQLMYSSTGWSLPAAMGAQAARPDSRVMVVIGDGSFQMTGQEISTMLRYQLNLIIIIINNSGYVIEDAIHKGPYNEIGGWNYTAFAKAIWGPSPSMKLDDDFDYFAAQVRTRGELQHALTRAYENPRTLALVECCIDPGKASTVIQRFGATLVRKS
jgi:pyruvate decarboxylase